MHPIQHEASQHGEAVAPPSAEASKHEMELHPTISSIEQAASDAGSDSAPSVASTAAASRPALEPMQQLPQASEVPQMPLQMPLNSLMQLPGVQLPMPMVEQQIQAIQQSSNGAGQKRGRRKQADKAEPAPKRRRGRPPKNGTKRTRRKYNKVKLKGKRPNTNPFLIFLCEQRELRKKAGETHIRNAELSKQLSCTWREMTQEQKLPYTQQAEVNKREYRRMVWEAQQEERQKKGLEPMPYVEEPVMPRRRTGLLSLVQQSQAMPMGPMVTSQQQQQQLMQQMQQRMVQFYMHAQQQQAQLAQQQAQQQAQQAQQQQAQQAQQQVQQAQQQVQHVHADTANADTQSTHSDAPSEARTCTSSAADDRSRPPSIVTDDKPAQQSQAQQMMVLMSPTWNASDPTSGSAFLSMPNTPSATSFFGSFLATSALTSPAHMATSSGTTGTTGTTTTTDNNVDKSDVPRAAESEDPGQQPAQAPLPLPIPLPMQLQMPPVPMPVQTKADAVLPFVPEHMETRDPETNERLFTCLVCNKVYRSKSGLMTHQRTQHMAPEKGTPFACTLCGKRFAWQSALDKHMRSHRSHVQKQQRAEAALLTRNWMQQNMNMLRMPGMQGMPGLQGMPGMMGVPGMGLNMAAAMAQAAAALPQGLGTGGLGGLSQSVPATQDLATQAASQVPPSTAPSTASAPSVPSVPSVEQSLQAMDQALGMPGIGGMQGMTGMQGMQGGMPLSNSAMMSLMMPPIPLPRDNADTDVQSDNTSNGATAASAATGATHSATKTEIKTEIKAEPKDEEEAAQTDQVPMAVVA